MNMPTKLDSQIEIQRFYGKPFDYFRLGKSVRDGQDFMRHMKASAEKLWDEAKQRNMLIDVKVCPICGSKSLKRLFDFLHFPYSQCENLECGHVFISRYVPDKLRHEFFAKDSGYSQKNYCDPDRAQFRIEQIAKPKAHFLRTHLTLPRGGRWLDVGCGSGEILHVLKQMGWEGIGLELSQQDAAFGREKYDVTIHEKTLESYKTISAEPFDVISFFGCLHCVADPAALIAEAGSMLKPGGALVVEVPNFDSFVTDAVSSFLDHPTRASYNGVTTLHLFTERSVCKAFARDNLTPAVVWYYGADIFEILNQWGFSDPKFIDTPLFQSLTQIATEIQFLLDQKRRSEIMLWIARK